MIKISVQSIWEFFTNSDKYTKILSITTPPNQNDTECIITKLGEHHLILYLNDVDKQIVDNNGKVYEPPSKEEVLKGLEFAKTWTEEDNVLIHCHAGISRSPAIAFGIIYYLTHFNKEETLAIMDNIAIHRMPNRAIMQIWREYFKDFPF